MPPRFTKPPSDVTEVEGNDVKITCDVTGHPSPTLSWYYNGKLVVSRDYITIKNNSLTVMEALDTDQGIYQCFVANDGGEIQGSAQLTVLDEGTLVFLLLLFPLMSVFTYYPTGSHPET